MVPDDYRVAGLDARESVWWLVAGLRIAGNPTLTVPAVADMSFGAMATAPGEPVSGRPKPRGGCSSEVASTAMLPACGGSRSTGRQLGNWLNGTSGSCFWCEQRMRRSSHQRPDLRRS